MGWLDVLIKPEAAPAPRPAVAGVQTAPAPVATGLPNFSQMGAVTAPPVVDPKFVQHFEELLSQINIPGPDFYEFRQVLQNMKAMGLTDDQLYKIAFGNLVVASGKNGTEFLDILKQSADLYLKALTDDKTEFASKIEAQMEAKVGGIQKEIEAKTKENEAAVTEINRLQALMSANNDIIVQNTANMQMASSKITDSQRSYNAAQEQIVAAIEDTKGKINKYCTI